MDVAEIEVKIVLRRLVVRHQLWWNSNFRPRARGDGWQQNVELIVFLKGRLTVPISGKKLAVQVRS